MGVCEAAALETGPPTVVRPQPRMGQHMTSELRTLSGQCCYDLQHLGAPLWPRPSPHWGPRPAARAHPLPPRFKDRQAQPQADTRGPRLVAEGQRGTGRKGEDDRREEGAARVHPGGTCPSHRHPSPAPPHLGGRPLLPRTTPPQRPLKAHAAKSEGHVALPRSPATAPQVTAAPGRGQAHSTAAPRLNTSPARSCLLPRPEDRPRGSQLGGVQASPHLSFPG